MRRFFYDILRDKNSTKFSITKVLALFFSLLFAAYLIFYLFIIQEGVDHTLTIEIIGLVLTLLGFKNNWGVSRTSKKTNNETVTTSTTTFENTSDATKDEQEGVF